MSRIGTHKTVVLYQDNNLEVYYHDTCVVNVSGAYITLNTGGWTTPTTKRRMNQTSEAYNLGYRVYQKDFNWYVDYNNRTMEFIGDKITFET